MPLWADHDLHLSPHIIVLLLIYFHLENLDYGSLQEAFLTLDQALLPVFLTSPTC